MNISGVNPSSQNSASSKQPTLDNQESSLRKEISQLQQEMKTISNDKEKSDEQKTKEKQAVQEQIQNLNKELRQHQLEKRQEEAAKRQEAIKQAAEKADTSRDKDDARTEDDADDNADQKPAVFGNEDSGVLISLSATKEQVANMGRIRTSLEGRQRTAATEEEKEDLQKKINNVSKSIGNKIVITEDTISTSRKNGKSGTAQQQGKKAASKQKADVPPVYADEKLDVLNRTGVINTKKMFDNIALITH